MWARIENDIIVELTDIDPAGRFHPDLIWILLTEEKTIGDAVSVEPKAASPKK